MEPDLLGWESILCGRPLSSPAEPTHTVSYETASLCRSAMLMASRVGHSLSEKRSHHKEGPMSMAETENQTVYPDPQWSGRKYRGPDQASLSYSVLHHSLRKGRRPGVRTPDWSSQPF